MSRRSQWALILGATVSFSACGGALRAFLDLPPPQEEQEEVAAPSSISSFEALLAQDTIRPPIEAVSDPDSVRAMLPRDGAGNLDWAAAVREEIIRPRSTIPGERPSTRLEGFAFDFYTRAQDTTWNAYFPHSQHADQLDCTTCHPTLFPYVNEPLSMAPIFAGESCGRCHGKVAFPVASCGRCHASQPLAPAGQGEFLGNSALARATDAEGRLVSDTTIFARSVFPHWVHRIQYKCAVCHDELFEPRAGANVVSMAQIAAGESCGRCHNGMTAFAANVTSCNRCHRPLASVPGP